jgi:hypothetical protein
MTTGTLLHPHKSEGEGSTYIYVKHFITFTLFPFFLVFWVFAKCSLASHDSRSLRQAGFAYS